MRDVQSMLRTKEFVSNTEQSKRKSIAVMKDAPSLHRKEEFAEAEATADRMTISTCFETFCGCRTIQERKEQIK